jgi:LPS O-antigen subunit length determinant protein (WzzB/FepE family)
MQGGSVQVAALKPAPESGAQPAVASGRTDIDLVAVALLFWGRRYWLLTVVLLTTAAAAYLAFTTPPTYRAEVVVTEVHDQGMGAAARLASEIGGLANNLADLGVGTNHMEPDFQALLDSHSLVQEYITRNNLLPQLSRGSRKPLSLWRAVQLFKKDVVFIRQDQRRGVTTLSAEWTDPDTAARWANGLVALANELLRTRALAEAQRNITYLNAQADRTTEVELHRAIFNLIENQTERLMLANGRPEYAFRIVDPAVPPEIRSAPHRTLLLATGVLVGLLLGGIGVLAVEWLQRQAARLRRDA